MRTTVTLEPDVAARVQRMQARGKFHFKEAVNEALRDWLDRGEQRGRAGKSFRQKTYDLKPRFQLDQLPSDVLKDLTEAEDLARFAPR